MPAGGRLARRTMNRSQDVFRSMQYCPIKSLLSTRAMIVKKIEDLDLVAEGKLQFMRSDGKIRYYNEEMHMNLFDKLTHIDKELMKYGYAPVPLTLKIEDERSAPLIIQLTAKGETYMINDYDEEETGDETDNTEQQAV